MTTNHTPGPWTINEWPQEDSEIRVGAAGTPRIATVHFRDVSINEQTANARLISVAPELLEALKACLTSGGALAYRNHEYALRRLEQITRIAENAIAKAEADAS